jgi:small subunit ribosomal protein S16
MIKIRLAREGSKKNPFYRIVAIDEKNKVRGKVLEILGTWYPKKDVKNINKDKVEKWIKLGAQKTQAVKSLLEK